MSVFSGEWMEPGDTDASAGVWSAPPGTPRRTKIATLNVPALAPGASATVQGALAMAADATPADSTAITGAYLVLDPGNVVKEINENDNHIVLTTVGPSGAASGKIWLPIINK